MLAHQETKSHMTFMVKLEDTTADYSLRHTFTQPLLFFCFMIFLNKVLSLAVSQLKNSDYSSINTSRIFFRILWVYSKSSDKITSINKIVPCIGQLFVSKIYLKKTLWPTLIIVINSQKEYFSHLFNIWSTEMSIIYQAIYYSSSVNGKYCAWSFVCIILWVFSFFGVIKSAMWTKSIDWTVSGSVDTNTFRIYIKKFMS